MPATSTKSSTFIPNFEAASERVIGANDRLVEITRKVTATYLDGIEKYIADFANFERKLGEQTNVDAAASLLGKHAQLTEDITKANISAARELITA